MVAPDAPWVGPHSGIYDRILEKLSKTPVGDLRGFLATQAGVVLDEILDSQAYRVDPSGGLTFGPGVPGAPSLFYDGSALKAVPLDMQAHRLGAFVDLARKIQGFAGEPLVVDLGAGTCIQAIVMRACGLNNPVLNLDVFKTALEIGEKLCSTLGIQDVHFSAVDLTNSANHEPLTTAIRRLADSRPIIVISRYAIYPFYDAREYAGLFDYLIRDVRVDGGVHLERTGRFTPTFKALQASVSGSFTISRKHQTKLDDPLGYLISRPDVEVIEHTEIFPHYVNEYFPRYLGWKRKAL